MTSSVQERQVSCISFQFCRIELRTCGVLGRYRQARGRDDLLRGRIEAALRELASAASTPAKSRDQRCEQSLRIDRKIDGASDGDKRRPRRRSEHGDMRGTLGYSRRQRFDS